MSLHREPVCEADKPLLFTREAERCAPDLPHAATKQECVRHEVEGSILLANSVSTTVSLE